ncbi:DUF4167 domain-containing protein [Novosphingobium sp. 1949]|uniref:DUF4167 domain-containing protein n=1 Tax=Novosphingobium organovorum TaxID=2930092 RepID=A0ABT0B9K2_9SPHN|nr:DUF4167 domain-containing protein [Novosphingobium organovorum]
MNRIDSRARGNAPQLLEKYKKLAHDAMLNGDRVQEEYYLQFADHYFRVIADQKQRQEEQRQPRRDDRSQDYDDDGADQEYPRPRETQRRYEAPAEPRASAEPRTSGESVEGEGEERSRSVYEPAENPFVRDSRSSRTTPKPRKPRRSDDERQDNAGEPAPASGGFDPATLPPSIGASGDEAYEDDATGEDKPAKRPRAKAKAPAAAAKPKTTRTRKSTDGEADAGKDTGKSETTQAAATEGEGEAKPRRRRITRKPASGEGAATNTADADA